jgi:hypothetical protein
MNAWVESLHRIEANERAEVHTLWTDFQIPEWIVVPESVSAGYAQLSEKGREDVHSNIEKALAWLEAKIHRVNANTTHELEHYTIYG